MWATYVLVAIVMMGTAFMIWVLVGLLRAPAPSIWYWVASAIARPRPE